MQKLTLFEDVFDTLATGKATTIRKGRINIELGELLFESTKAKRKEIVFVKMVYFCLLGDVLLDDLSNDGFKDQDDMCLKMKRFYPEITLESEVTVIKFIRPNSSAKKLK